jgi:carbon monoxide dehydrogenase subunit G
MDVSVEKFIKDFKGRVEMKAELPPQKVAEIKKEGSRSQGFK